MEVRRSLPADLPAIEAIYTAARAFMAAGGNPDQWGNGYPPRPLIESDIAAGKSFVCTEGDAVAGVFYFAQEEEPTYREIDGAWLNDEPYGVVHRVAAAPGARGVATLCLDWCFRQCPNIRIDTHRNNAPMNGLLVKRGFIRCGIVRMADGSDRIAYQKTE